MIQDTLMSARQFTDFRGKKIRRVILSADKHVLSLILEDGSDIRIEGSDGTRVALSERIPTGFLRHYLALEPQAWNRPKPLTSAELEDYLSRSEVSQYSLIGTRLLKTICLRQPWAALVADGPKSIETRTWCTKYRGPLLIVASKAKPDWSGVYFGPYSKNEALHRAQLYLEEKARQQTALHFGEAIAITRLVDCREMTTQDEKPAMCRLYPHAKAWVLSDTRKITPFPVKGQLGLFTVEMPKQ
jgi:hypothetical protein